MVVYSFILSFILEFAASFLFVSILLALLKPNHPEIKKDAFIALMTVTFLSIGGAEFNFFIKLFIFIAFFLYGIKLFIKVIYYRGKQESIKEYKKKKIEPKYSFDETIERINHVSLFLITCNFLFIAFFLGKNDISSFVGIVFFLLLILVIFNHYSKAHIKNTTKFDANSIKTNLFTLMALTLMLSVMLFFALLLIPFENYLQIQVKLYPIFAFIMVFPPILVSDHFLKRLRMTFFENKKINEYFISNLLTYTVVVLIFTIILSDVIVAYSVIKSQNYENMVLWVIGFVVFIGYTFIDIIKKSYLYKLESGLITIKDVF